MSALLQQSIKDSTIFEEVCLHPAWHGTLKGLPAEKLLRGKKTAYLYIIRQEEEQSSEDQRNYYITYKHADGSERHQPFTLTIKAEGWSYEQGGIGGPFSTLTSIDDVVHAMIHCEKAQAIPLIKGC